VFATFYLVLREPLRFLERLRNHEWFVKVRACSSAG
jgi:hypothetical protein